MAARAVGGASRQRLSFGRRACAAIVVAAAVSLAGCQSLKETGNELFPPGAGLVAQLRGAGGSAAAGVVYVFNARDGVQVQLSISNLLPGTYRIALHEGGNCRSPNLFSAGPAWAPPGSNKPPGDLLPQFNANMDMNMNNYVAYISGARTEGPLSLRGRVVVLHWGNTIEQAFPGQPNNRIACGVLEAADPLFQRDN